MPSVESEITIAAPIERIYALARDIERFPEFMADVQSVEILEQTPDRQVSRWVGLVKEFKRTVTWTEEDFWDEEQRRCTFRQIEGDYSKYEGTWEFAEHPQGTEVCLQIDFEYDVPLIGSLIKGLLRRTMQANVEAMLQALKRQAEA